MSATAPQTQGKAKPYQIVSTTADTKWSTQLQEAVSGWLVRALWLPTNTILPVFVPDDVYTADNVNQLVLAAGAKNSAVHNLGA